MMLDQDFQMTVRAAVATDLPALIAIKGADSEALHRDRLGDAQAPSFRYLVLVVEGAVIGFACLVMRRPAYWSDGQDTTHLPQIVDLQVAEAQRGRGYGTAFIHSMEQMAVEAGYGCLYISVEPLHNPRAYALYQRLGYHPLQVEPYQKRWTFTDSAGTIHQGEAWVVDLIKEIATA